jgi:hypothetical protein
MDRKSDHGSLRLGTSSPISDPRSGWGLWRDLHPKTSINGHSRPADGAARALAALFGGTVGKDTVSRTWRKVKSDWDAWNTRSLAGEPIARLILDGTVIPSGGFSFVG